MVGIKSIRTFESVREHCFTYPGLDVVVSSSLTETYFTKKGQDAYQYRDRIAF